MDVTILIHHFRRFIEAAWPSVSSILLNNEEFKEQIIDNWLQANWEQLVEQNLFSCSAGYVLEYGNGADYDCESNRVSFPEEEPTHAIICKAKTTECLVDKFTEKKVIDNHVIFRSFVSWNGHQYSNEPPLDYVLAEIGDDYCLLENKHILFEIVEF